MNEAAKQQLDRQLRIAVADWREARRAYVERPTDANEDAAWLAYGDVTDVQAAFVDAGYDAPSVDLSVPV